MKVISKFYEEVKFIQYETMPKCNTFRSGVANLEIINYREPSRFLKLLYNYFYILNQNQIEIIHT